MMNDQFPGDSNPAAAIEISTAIWFVNPTPPGFQYRVAGSFPTATPAIPNPAEYAFTGGKALLKGFADDIPHKISSAVRMIIVDKSFFITISIIHRFVESKTLRDGTKILNDNGGIFSKFRLIFTDSLCRG